MPLTAAKERALKPKDSFRECIECPEMVVVPKGSFMMGSPESEEFRNLDEGPLHMVRFAKPFAIGRFEVTFAEWDACVAAGDCKYGSKDQGRERGKRPVGDVSWDDITKEYLPWLSHRTGKSYRLPTEAEWEYAARAGTKTPYWTGRTITKSQANINFGSAKGTVEVGSFQPNDFGLYDTHGNVSEWVQDCHVSSYAGVPVDGSAAEPKSLCTRVVRGGAWHHDALFVRVAHRTWIWPHLRGVGFRVARTLAP